ncbi:hypothetical protein CFOL_v3_35858, partial [Cephalotus follicularis]
VCKPKKEGGIGLRRSSDCNKAAVMKLIWDLLSEKPSLWVKWSKAEILRGNSFWQMERKQGLSVTWKAILRIRSCVSANLVYSVGPNSSWSLWFDPWLHSTSLVDRLGTRAIYDTGLPREATLSEVIQDSNWSWPSHVWQFLCPFGCGQGETVDHLFFDCAFTKAVWSKVMKMNNCQLPTSWNWNHTAAWAVEHTVGKHFSLWMRRAGQAASVYHCWRERNNRI